MENELSALMEIIMERILKNEYESFIYDDGKFHYIDKEMGIDFQATFGNHNYYLRDNLTDSTYITTRKSIGDEIFIHQIIMCNSTNKYYAAFFSKEDMYGIIKSYCIDEKGSLVCNNPDCIARFENDDALKEYIEAFFREEFMEEDEEEIDESIEVDNEDQNIDTTSKSLLDVDSECEEEEYDSSYVDNGEFLDVYGEDQDDDSIFENEFQVIVNGTEISGKAKAEMISTCAVDLLNRYDALMDVEMIAENLKNLLKDISNGIER